MIEGHYEIVFKKLEEEMTEEVSQNQGDERIEIKRIQAESDEIAELRRIVLEITEAQSIYYSGT